MDLILVRHAIAAERDRFRWPDDSTRPLTPEGTMRFERAAAGLRRVQASVDLVLSSPYVRAWQTAQILKEITGWPEPTASSELEPMNDVQRVIDLCNQQAVDTLALVSHEPLLGDLAGFLLTGTEGMAQPLKKGGAVRFTFESKVIAGGTVLVWWLTPRVLRLLAAP